MRFFFGHEAYVTNRQAFFNGVNGPAHTTIGQLINRHHLALSIGLTLLITLSYLVAIGLSAWPPVARLGKKFERGAKFAPALIRIGVAAALILAAASHSIFGPELQLGDVTTGTTVLRLLLILIGALLLAGLAVQPAAWLGLVLFFFMAFFWHTYLLTYLTYFGALMAILIMGGDVYTLDAKLRSTPISGSWLRRYQTQAIPIIRVCFGVALIYTAITVKLLHPDLTVAVYNQYHLANFFHMNADYFVAGAGLVELLVGFCIVFGLALRWTLFLLLAMMTLALLYFGEVVWPHLILYVLAIGLIISPKDRYTVDRWMKPYIDKILGRAQA
ncbi:MAG TPA: DoxX family membrane protein [Candidatus Saccharimonadales bacterium]|nr:DoxX family membrane protein [Candidatus Saccharimonadales bacterium]